ncbi:MAG: phosphatidylinositol mannoside acyltransferase [Acidimicrobiales bacterium]
MSAYRAGMAAASVLPGEVSRSMGETFAVMASRAFSVPGAESSMAHRRALVARHLSRVLGPGLGPRRLRHLVDETFASYGRYWAESFRLPSLRASQVYSGMVADGFDHIVEGEAAGRGVILALPHLGGWEWAGTWLAQNGHPISVVVEALEPPELFRWFVSFRERLGMEVIPVGAGAAAACARALAGNRILALLCDRAVGEAAAVEVEFFGERTLLPAGPATLALRTGAVVLPTAVYFGPGASDHRAWVRPPLQLERKGRLRDDVQAGTEALARELELLVRRAPTQWHLIQPNWPSDSR